MYKKFIFFVLFLNLMLNFCQGQDSIVGRKAYEYILNSSILEDAFGVKVQGICISEEVLKPSTNDFSKQIIQSLKLSHFL